MKSALSIVSLFALVSMLFVGGVSAAWSYHGTLPEWVETDAAGVYLTEFEFAPEEILPDDEEADQAGENHVTLIENIVNHRTYGLNATSKPIVRDLLLEDGEPAVYSQQKVQGGNLKHLLVGGSTVNRLDFVVEYVSDTELACYTMQTSLLNSDNYGVTISVYKTKIVLVDGKWDATVSYEGEATVQRVTSGGSSFVSIDIASWKRT